MSIISFVRSKRWESKTMNNNIVGERIKELRMKRNMTREKLAELADLSVSFIYEIETGKKSFSAYTLVNLAKAFDVDADYILYGNKNHSKYTVSGEPSLNDTLLYIQKLLTDALDDIKDIINT